MEGANKNYHGKTHKQKDKFAFKFIFPFNLLLVEQIVIVHYTQSCFLLSYISVISSMFTNKFVKKCQYYYTLLEQSVPLVTVTSVVSLLTKQLWLHRTTIDHWPIPRRGLIKTHHIEWRMKALFLWWRIQFRQEEISFRKSTDNQK